MRREPRRQSGVGRFGRERLLLLFLGEAPSQRKVVGSAVALGGVLAYGLSRGAAPAKPKKA